MKPWLTLLCGGHSKRTRTVYRETKCLAPVEVGRLRGRVSELVLHAALGELGGRVSGVVVVVPPGGVGRVLGGLLCGVAGGWWGVECRVHVDSVRAGNAFALLSAARVHGLRFVVSVNGDDFHWPGGWFSGCALGVGSGYELCLAAGEYSGRSAKTLLEVDSLGRVRGVGRGVSGLAYTGWAAVDLGVVGYRPVWDEGAGEYTDTALYADALGRGARARAAVHPGGWWLDFGDPSVLAAHLVRG